MYYVYAIHVSMLLATIMLLGIWIVVLVHIIIIIIIIKW